MADGIFWGIWSFLMWSVGMALAVLAFEAIHPAVGIFLGNGVTALVVAMWAAD